MGKLGNEQITKIIVRNARQTGNSNRMAFLAWTLLKRNLFKKRW